MNRIREKLRLGWRGARSQMRRVLIGSGVFGVGLLLGLHLFFPTTTARQWLTTQLAARTPVSMQFETLSVQPIFVLSGRNAQIMAADRTAPLATLDEFRIKPLWTALLSANPGLVLNASLLQGQLAATLRRSGDLALTASGVRLADIPLHPDTRTLFSGTLIQGTLQRSLPARKTVDNRLTLQLDNAALTIMGQPLPLGQVTIEGTGQGNSLRFTTLTANGGALVISGTGNLLLGPSLAASRLQLELDLRPTASAPATLTSLLELAATRLGDNRYRLRVSGSPAALGLEPAQPAPGSEPVQPPPDSDPES